MHVARGSAFFRGSSVCPSLQQKRAQCCKRTKKLQTNALKTPEGPSIVIVDSLGLMGEKCLKAIKEVNLPYSKLRLLASDAAVGATQEFDGDKYTIEKLEESSFDGVDLALFIAEDTDSIDDFGPVALFAGATVGRCILDDKNKLIVQEGFFEEVKESDEPEEDQETAEKEEGAGGGVKEEASTASP